MLLTLEIITAFVRCRYKAFLKCMGEVKVATEYESLERDLAGEYQAQAIAWLTPRFTPTEIVSSPPSLEHVLQNRSRLILNAPCNPERGAIEFPAIERTASRTSTGKPDHALIVFSPNIKLSKDETLTAAMLGTALSSWHGLVVPCVKMVHGPQFSTTKLVLVGNDGRTHLGNESAAMLRDLEALAASPAPPPMCLNDHCGICEYRDRCRKDAVGRDDLSLLRGLSPKEIEAWKERGIFTVTQLAHTFRAKSMGRSSCQPKRHSQPLQAMAIRDKKTYVRKCPEIPTQPSRVFFDVEGIPGHNFFYLIGAVVVRDGTATSHEFWADNDSQEECMWRKFLALLAELGDFRLIHFGRYEKDFIREMQRRYPFGSEEEAEQLLSRLFDVHGAIRTNVFFPVYGNSLKEIGQFIGFSWQGPVRSGIDSIVWRHKWEETGDGAAKEALLRYNQEDCLATMALFDHLSILARNENDTSIGCQNIDNMPYRRKGEFGSRAFALPAMKTMTRRAYFNYQQNKVFFRTDKNVRKSVNRKRFAAKAKIRVSAVITCPPPHECPKCGSLRMTTYQNRRQSKIVRDLKFMRCGVKRWIVKYETNRHQCLDCRHTCYSPKYPTKLPKFGQGVAGWAAYQHIALRQSFEGVTVSVNDLFGYSFSEPTIQRAIEMLAMEHEATENLLLSKLRSGNLICGDEAKIKIRRNVCGYVWAFSGPEVVIYRFSKSRDSTVMDEVLKGFGGVLVSDFYNVYDSAPCPQQKCLIHLMRDINDDLLKAPFDEELKELATRFTALMTPIVESIDRYGLTKRHLGKYDGDAERYRKWVAGQQFALKVAQGYQKRIGKYGERLFTFLSHDGVPWHNNLAENAVKLVVSRRNSWMA